MVFNILLAILDVCSPQSTASNAELIGVELSCVSLLTNLTEGQFPRNTAQKDVSESDSNSHPGVCCAISNHCPIGALADLIRKERTLMNRKLFLYLDKHRQYIIMAT